MKHTLQLYIQIPDIQSTRFLNINMVHLLILINIIWTHTATSLYRKQKLSILIDIYFCRSSPVCVGPPHYCARPRFNDHIIHVPLSTSEVLSCRLLSYTWMSCSIWDLEGYKKKWTSQKQVSLIWDLACKVICHQEQKPRSVALKLVVIPADQEEWVFPYVKQHIVFHSWDY